MTTLPASRERVPAHTSAESNRSIRARTERDVDYFRAHPSAIDARLRELAAEWDVERALETGSACLSLLGLSLGIMRRRAWLALPLVVQGFFLQHALQGWCPPLPLLRALGFRTEAEIADERCALEAIRAA